jgi:drug/metabolite transporter (DMT)-like permease
MKRPAPLLLIIAAGVAAVSTAAPLIKLCDDAAPVVIAAARLGIAAALLAPAAAAIRGRKLLHVSASNAKYLFLAGAFLGAHFYFWITSLKHTSVLSSVVIVTTNPIFVAAASYFLFKEKIRRRLILAIILATAGGVLIALSDANGESGADSLYGDFLALAGAIMASCYLLVGRKVRRQVDTIGYITPVYTVAAVLLIALALAGSHRFAGYRNNTYLYFMLLALGPQLLGHSAFNWALRHVTATAVTVFILGEAIGATLLAYFLLNESVRPLQICGGALMLGGILIASQAPTLSPPANCLAQDNCGKTPS